MVECSYLWVHFSGIVPFFVPSKVPLLPDMGLGDGILGQSQEGIYKPLSPLHGNGSPSILLNGRDLETFLIFSPENSFCVPIKTQVGSGTGCLLAALPSSPFFVAECLLHYLIFRELYFNSADSFLTFVGIWQATLSTDGLDSRNCACSCPRQRHCQ